MSSTMSFTEGTRHLSQACQAAHDARVATNATNRRVSAQTLSTLRADQSAAAREQQQKLTEDRMTNQRETAGALNVFHTDRVAAAATRRRSLTDGRMTNQRETAGTLSAFHTDRLAAAKIQRRKLQSERAALRRETRATLNANHNSHTAMARAQHQMLAGDIAVLQQANAATMRGFTSDRLAMSKEQHRLLAASRSRLAKAVAQSRADLQSDRAEGRGAWRRMAEHNRRPLRSSRVVTVPPKAASQPASARPADDLTTIRGIGPEMARRLKPRGIRTFAQLAAAKPEALREMLGDGGRLAKVEDWIEQARSLTKSE